MEFLLWHLNGTKNYPQEDAVKNTAAALKQSFIVCSHSVEQHLSDCIP